MKKIYEDIKKVFESRTSFIVLCGIGVAIIVLLIFSLGVMVGFRKASFSQAWEENYERNFGMRTDRPIFDNFPNESGAIGKIIKITLPTLIVADKNNTEKVILLEDDTQIQKMKQPILASDLKVDDFIVVIGVPNTQGQIEAKFIRIMPLGLPTIPSQTPAPTN
jgi:hypothetical protein